MFSLNLISEYYDFKLHNIKIVTYSTLGELSGLQPFSQPSEFCLSFTIFPSFLCLAERLQSMQHLPKNFHCRNISVVIRTSHSQYACCYKLSAKSIRRIQFATYLRCPSFERVLSLSHLAGFEFRTQRVGTKNQRRAR